MHTHGQRQTASLKRAKRERGGGTEEAKLLGSEFVPYLLFFVPQQTFSSVLRGESKREFVCGYAFFGASDLAL